MSTACVTLARRPGIGRRGQVARADLDVVAALGEVDADGCVVDVARGRTGSWAFQSFEVVGGHGDLAAKTGVQPHVGQVGGLGRLGVQELRSSRTRSAGGRRRDLPARP